MSKLNLRNEDTKMIKILSEKHVYSKGGIYGPVLTPFRESVANIFLMLLENVKLSEVLADGKEVELTFQNFNTVNTGVAEEEVEEEEEVAGGDEEAGEEPQLQTEPTVREGKPQHNQQQKNQKKFKEDKLNKK